MLFRSVPPASIPDYLGLVGDAADGIPGIPRWGAKTAALVLDRYGQIENIPDDPEQWDVRPRGTQAVAASLAERREEAALYKRLTTLRCSEALAVGASGGLIWPISTPEGALGCGL